MNGCLGRHWNLIITLDDATSEHYSMFFVEEEGTASSFRGMALVERVPLYGALDMGTCPHQRLGGRGMGLDNSRGPDVRSRCRPAPR